MSTRETSKLKGPALDWAVAYALGYRPAKREKRNWGYSIVPAPEKTFSLLLLNDEGRRLNLSAFCPSVQESQGLWIIESYGLSCIRAHVNPHPNRWVSEYSNGGVGTDHGRSHGPTLLVAAMRCFVSGQLGHEVEIPEDLK